jgi:CMP-N,N'-diacetyllegionaminic acid synthase
VTLALVPAKGRSTGIPGKNTRLFSGRPLLSWAIQTGRITCDRTLVTTDDSYVAEAAAEYGAWIITRPAELATDEAPMLSVVQHAIRNLECDVVVLLQPTQPLRRPEHIRAALKLLEETGADSVVSVVEIPAHYSPEYALEIDEGELLPVLGDKYSAGRSLGRMLTRRQDAQPAYTRDGTVYAIKRETIEAGSLYGNDCRALIIPRSESVNLDTEEDWTMAEARCS